MPLLETGSNFSSLVMMRASEQGCLAPRDGLELADGRRETAPENFHMPWCSDSEVLFHYPSFVLWFWTSFICCLSLCNSGRSNWDWFVAFYFSSNTLLLLKMSGFLTPWGLPTGPALWLSCLLCATVIGARLGTSWSLDLSQLLPRSNHVTDGNFCIAREDPWGESYMRSIELKYKCTLVMSQIPVSLGNWKEPGWFPDTLWAWGQVGCRLSYMARGKLTEHTPDTRSDFISGSLRIPFNAAFF